MKMKIAKLLIVLSIIFVIIVSGCSKQDNTQQKPNEATSQTSTETTGQAIDSVGSDLSSADSIGDDSNLSDLDNLDKDLDVGY